MVDPPGDHHLARPHSSLPQRDPALQRWFPAGLLLELPGRSHLVCLAILDEPFEESPCAAISSGEERPSWMGDENFEPAVETVGEKTRGSHGARHYAGRVTVLATYPPADTGLAAFDTQLELGRSEPLGVGVKRVTMEQLELAASGYFDGEEAFSSAVHESRKAIKRVRSVLRLVRGELSEKVFAYEDKALRDTGRMITDLRSATSVVEASELIRDLYGDLLAPDTFAEMIARLGRRREIIELRALEDPNLIGRVVRNLERAYHRYSTWPTEDEAREIYGMGIRDSFKAIRPGLHATYGQGRKQMVAAYSDPAAVRFHRWRKRAKYLRHQMEFLAPLWPEVVMGMAVTLDRLSLILGEDHDLHEVMTLLQERPDLCPNPRERSLFAALATQRLSELRVAAEILGRRVYAERPSSLQARFGEYWDSRQLAIATPLDTLTID